MVEPASVSPAGTRPHDPASARAKAEQVKQDRRVWIGQSGDDHADIAGTLDGIGAEVLDRRLDQLATTLGQVTRTHGDGRAVRDCASGLNPVTLYIHLRADHTLDLEGLASCRCPPWPTCSPRAPPPCGSNR